MSSDDTIRPQISGDKLGHYIVMEKIGSGGMGIVYKGWDTHLDRPVALKVLLPDIVTDAEHRRRFVQEAKAASALNHPNIITIYDISRSNDIDFIAMEYLEGKTLEQRIGEGKIPPQAALPWAIQIADALGKAHSSGIIHRDLKPSNLMVKSDGQIKILDFGLAKLISPDEGVPSLLLSKKSRVMGTLAYMSPEQLEGHPVDARTDIFAFGLILYEMFTGKRPVRMLSHFSENHPSTGIPPAVERVVMRCLRKEPQRRWQSLQDLKAVLEDIDPGSLQNRFRLARLRRGLLPGAALLAMLAMGLTLGKFTWHPAAHPVTNTTIRLESGLWLSGMRRETDRQRPSRTAITLAKDGSFIIYSACPAGSEKNQLYMRKIDQAEAKPIPGTEGGINPFLSPDNRWVGFWADKKLKKVPVTGGIPVALCEATSLFGASWSEKDTILFAGALGTGLRLVSAQGGEITPCTTEDKSREMHHRLPHCLPGGRSALFTVMRELWDRQPNLALLDLSTKKWKVVQEDAADGTYLPTGHLAFLRQGLLMVAPFDLKRGAVTGKPVPAVPNVLQALNLNHLDYDSAAGQFCVSDNGTLLYAEGGTLPENQDRLAWMDFQGKCEPITSFTAPFHAPRLSPDGRYIAYTTLGMKQDLWIYDLQRGTNTRFTDKGRVFYALWTLDGKKLIYSLNQAGLFTLFSQTATEVGTPETLTSSTSWLCPFACSPDGNTLLYSSDRLDLDTNLNVLDLRTRSTQPLFESEDYFYYADLAPNGRYFCYASDDTGKMEVYVSPTSGKGERWKISQGGAREPLWSRDGKGLYYKSLNLNQFWSVEVQTQGTFSAGKPKMLFETELIDGSTPVRGWDLSPDGKRFLVVKREKTHPKPVTELTLVSRWFQTVERLSQTSQQTPQPAKK